MKISREILLDRLYRSIKENHIALDIYIDTPFCATFCKYCMFHPVKYNKVLWDKYWEYVLQYLKDAQHILNIANIKTVYFGGGTAGLIRVETLKEIAKLIPNFKYIPNKTIEFHPNTITKEKVDFVIENNFKLVSIGIQSTDKEILKEQNRATYNFDKLREYISCMKENNICVSCDLLGYIGCEDYNAIYTEERAKKELEILKNDIVEVANNLNPSKIDIYPNIFYFKIDETDKQDKSTNAKKSFLFRKAIKEILPKIEKYKSWEVSFSYKEIYDYAQIDKINKVTLFEKSFNMEKFTSVYNEYNCDFMSADSNDCLAIGGLRGKSWVAQSCYGKTGNLFYTTRLFITEDNNYIEWIEDGKELPCYPKSF